jgi:hypothetical protein
VLATLPDGRYWLSITDMGSDDGAWLSSDLTPDELRELARAIALEVG